MVSPTLILSGYVKAIDPLGTQYKIQDYLSALSLDGIFPDWTTLGTSVLLSAIEFSLGIFLLFAIHRRLVTKLVLALMVVMTVISAWLWIANPISDCGCFGDAIVLTNGHQWIVINYTLLFVLLSSLYCLYDLPLFDFRPYHVGSDLRKGMEVPDSAAQPEFETTFILEKDGERREFSLADYPDSTWTFIDSRTVMVKEGYVPPIHDFSIETAEGDDITEDVLSDPGYTFLLISPHLENANDSDFGNIDQIYEYSQDNGYNFYCLTASGEGGIERWRELTGAEYPFCTTDATTLKTIIRSNPGLLLLHNGVVIRKWSHHFLPDATQLTGRLEDIETGQMPPDATAAKIIKILLWFALPLFALALADRLWAWTRLLKRKK